MSETPNCPCDELVFPRELKIAAGLTRVPRQIATFPEFRAAMLRAIAAKAPLSQWRARDSGDFGLMLLEMWAYVCDNVSFYDQVHAHESFLRTATDRASLRKLVTLLGYIPRPAVAASVDLAVLAEGRQSVALPPGMQFRSGAFPGSPPQVFELEAPATAHPLLNQWQIQRQRPATLAGESDAATVTFDSVLLESSTAAIEPAQFVLLEITGDFSRSQARTVTDTADVPAADGEVYKQVSWNGSVSLPGNTPTSHMRLMTPALTATLWRIPSKPVLIEDALFGALTAVKKLEFSTIAAKASSKISAADFAFGVYDAGSLALLMFDGLYRQIRLGSRLILEKEGELRWFKVIDLGDSGMDLPGSGSSPAPKVPVTWVRLDAAINDASRKPPGSANWTTADAPAIVVHYGMEPAGTVVQPFVRYLRPGDRMPLVPPVEAPTDGSTASRFLLEDRDGTGVRVDGAVDFRKPEIALDAPSPLPAALATPVAAYGNLIRATRGETVAVEVLGAGDASVSNQSFKLKKKPLTYVSAPSAGSESGVRSSLRVYVDGVLWTEATTFFGAREGSEVYIVRHDDAGEATITFGSGEIGRRLPTGAAVVASYRFGAGRLSPPAGSITQLAKPIKGVRSVRNPVAAFGGDDAEESGGIRRFAPRSALLLGRAVSIADMEVAAKIGGVRAVKAEWRWHERQQRPVVQIWYIGAAALAEMIAQTLRHLADPSTPIGVDQAVGVPRTLSVAVTIDPRRREDDVLAAVRQALIDPETGLLAPERIGIGEPLFRSRLFESVLAVPGAGSVTALLLDGNPFDAFGISPGSGKYFDFEAGGLLLNGRGPRA